MDNKAPIVQCITDLSDNYQFSNVKWLPKLKGIYVVRARDNNNGLPILFFEEGVIGYTGRGKEIGADMNCFRELKGFDIKEETKKEKEEYA